MLKKQSQNNNNQPDDYDSLEHKLALYHHMQTIYPKESKYLQRKAEVLLQLNREGEAEEVFNQLHDLLKQQGHHDTALQINNLRETLQRERLVRQPYAAPFLNLKNQTFLSTLFKKHRRLDLKEGEYLMRQGEESEQMYIILSGELAVWIQLEEDGEPMLAHILGDGEIVGEMAFLLGQQRSADVLVCKDTSLIEFPRQEVIQLLLEHPDIETALMHEAHIRKHIVSIRLNPYLANIPMYLQRQLAQSAELLHFSSLQRIHQSGHRIEYIDMILSGYTRFIGEDAMGNSHVMNAYKAGELLGASAVVNAKHDALSNHYNADIVAIEDTTILRFPVDAFVQVADKYSPLHQVLTIKSHEIISVAVANASELNKETT